MNTSRKQIHLAAHFPGVNNTTVWSDPASASQIDFASFIHLAQTAERGLFDFFFLAEGLRLREHLGRIFDLDVVGRPDTFTVLDALAAVTSRLGLIGTINATFNEPYELARQFASLDHLSGGRAGWNVVTSSDAFTGENFRRGGYLAHSQRYERAEESVAVARKLWDAWATDAVAADAARGVFIEPGAVSTVVHRGSQFSISGPPGLPAGPQGHPVLLQAGDSDQGREFGATKADAIFSRHGTLEAGQAFYRDMKAKAVRHGRSADELKILPGVTVVVGDTDADAQEKAAYIRRQQVSPQTAIATLERVWGRDLSEYDPDGPLPEDDPVVDGVPVTQGRTRDSNSPIAVAQKWRALAAERGLSIRELIIETTARQSFIGSASEVARQLDEHVQADAADGFILVPHLTPGGLDEVVDRVVPELQDRGVFRTEYTGTTLRDHLGLPHPHRSGQQEQAS